MWLQHSPEGYSGICGTTSWCSLNSHCIVFFGVEHLCFFSNTRWNKPVKNSWRSNVLYNTWKVGCERSSNWYVFDSHLRTHILVTRSLWHQSSETVTVFVASLFSLTLNNLYPVYTCQTSVPITFLCVILKIFQFLTLAWQQGIWWDQLVFQLLDKDSWPKIAPTTASSGS